MAEAVRVPAQLVLPGSLQAKQLCPTFILNSHWGLCLVYRVTSVMSNLFATVLPEACQASLSGGFSRQEYWSVLANIGCHTLLEHCISCCLSCQLPWYHGELEIHLKQ